MPKITNKFWIPEITITKRFERIKDCLTKLTFTKKIENRFLNNKKQDLKIYLKKLNLVLQKIQINLKKKIITIKNNQNYSYQENRKQKNK